MASPFAYQPFNTEADGIHLVSIVKDNDNKALPFHCRIFHASLDGSSPYTALSYVWQQPILSLSEEYATSPAWKALRDLLMRSWWERTWVIQEFLLAQVVDFLCGDQRLKGEQMEAAKKLLFQDGWYKVFATGTLQKIRMNSRTFTQLRHIHTIRDRLRYGEPIGILKFLSMTRDSLAWDSRDSIYGKVGLIGDRAAAVCRPDYRDAMLDICRTFAENYIRNEGDLYINLPCWDGSKEFSKPNADLPRGAKPEVELLENSLVLKCQGVVFDDIDGVQFNPWSHRAPEQKTGFQSHFKDCAYCTKKQAFDALYGTVVANTNRWGEQSKAPAHFGLLFAMRCQECDVLLQNEQTPHGHIPTEPRTGASNFEKRWQGMRDLKLGGCLLQDLVEEALMSFMAGKSCSFPPTRVQHRPSSEHAL